MLLTKNVQPAYRIGSGPKGVEEIKNHVFFDGINWMLLENRQVTPPFVPKIESEQDTGNIDKMFTKELPTETPEDSMLLKKQKFDGFTYVEQGYL